MALDGHVVLAATKIAEALKECFVTTSDEGKKQNVVDGLFAIAEAIDDFEITVSEIAEQYKPGKADLGLG